VVAEGEPVDTHHAGDKRGYDCGVADLTWGLVPLWMFALPPSRASTAYLTADPAVNFLLISAPIWL